MATIKHNHFLDTVDQVFNYAKALKIIHLRAEGDTFNGRYLKVEGKNLYHFGTTGYLGLEQDERLKQAAISAISNYGTQFPLSKSYIAHPLYNELEEKMKKLYGREVIITKNATLAHMAALPVLVGDGDAIILDHQVHWSVQDAAKRLKLRGVRIELLRHNRLDLLQEKIRKLGSKAERIWYVADGVYSMYGDYAPVLELMQIAKKYKQLHLYFDDVHGMSWAGPLGQGYVFGELQSLSENVVIIGTLSKTFGANGSFILCGDRELHEKIKNFGGSLTFSAQLDPASVGAAIASANLHLSGEILEYQQQLQERIRYFNQLIEDKELPLVAKNDSPVFFLATGIPETGYQLTRALLERGFYVNMGLFPAVPSKNTGLRITLSLHNQFEDIQGLAHHLKELYPLIMHSTGNSFEQLSRAFQQDFADLGTQKRETSLNLHVYSSIKALSPTLWDSHFSGKGILDWEGFHFIENAFRSSSQPEHKWNFLYFHLTDEEGETMILAAFTISLWKDDLLAPPKLSKKIEQKRQTDPYWQTSKVMGLGSLFSDGLPLYVNHGHPAIHTGLQQFFKKIDELSEQHQTAQLVLRDFDPSRKLQAILNQQGYIPMDMPEVALVEPLGWENTDAFLTRLSTRSRRHFRKDIQPFQAKVSVLCETQVSKERLQDFYQLFTQVHQRNLGLNIFLYPLKVFEEMNRNPNWEFLYLTPNNQEDQILGVMFCYKNGRQTYVPSLIGLDYDHLTTYQTYRQLLFESLQRANGLGFTQVDFGISANFEKQKLGAKLHPKKAFVKSDSNFRMDNLEIQLG